MSKSNTKSKHYLFPCLVLMIASQIFIPYKSSSQSFQSKPWSLAGINTSDTLPTHQYIRIKSFWFANFVGTAELQLTGSSGVFLSFPIVMQQDNNASMSVYKEVNISIEPNEFSSIKLVTHSTSAPMIYISGIEYVK